MCIYIFIYVYICVHICVYVCINTHKPIFVHTCVTTAEGNENRNGVVDV